MSVAGSSPVGDAPFISLKPTQLRNSPDRDPGYARSTGLLAVAQLRGCRGVETGGHLGRIGQWFGKALYREFIEEFPDLVSGVSEVSNG